MDIQTTLLTSLRKLAEQHTTETLGDRREYLGSSDIGYCPRKVILEKMHPGEHSLTTLLRFQRGHIAEDIIANAFTAAGYSNFERQVEITLSGDAPVTVHIDFVFTSETQKIKSILEVKTTDPIPNTAYSSWESQLYLQMGALAKRYPGYTIKGAILPIDLSEGEIDFFNGYTPQETLFSGLLDRAGRIWSDYQTVQSGKEVELKTEVSPLCGYCNHIATCPCFEAEVVPEMAGIVSELQQMQIRGKKLEALIKGYKRKLLAVVEQKGPINSGGSIFRKATRTRKDFANDRLAAFLAEHGASIDEFKNETTYSFLEIKKIKSVAN